MPGYAGEYIVSTADIEVMTASERLNIRLSPEQLAQIKQTAESCGLSLSAYVLNKALETEAVTKPVSVLSADDLALVRAIRESLDTQTSQQLVGPSVEPEPEEMELAEPYRLKKLTWEQREEIREREARELDARGYSSWG